MSRKLEIISMKGIKFVPVKKVILLKASGSYTEVFVKAPGEKLVIHHQSRNIGQYEQVLGVKFVRVHRSYLVNSRYIIGLGIDRAVYVQTPEGVNVITAPKLNWVERKLKICQQITFPFHKKAGS